MAQAIEEKNAGNPMPADMLVKAVGLHQPDDWRFLDLLRSAALFGITSGTGVKSDVELTPLGRDIVAPASPNERTLALSRAFEKVDVFNKVAAYYKGKPYPEDEYFGNLLTRQFGVQKDRLDRFIDVFLSSDRYVKSFGTRDAGATTVRRPQSNHRPEAVIAELKPVMLDGTVRPREFLDTCFVLMPFGGWFDTYYRDVYSPAIKEAGFEPIRADDLFHSGAVMEQIWEEIRKAKVLVAELTGKNANVFYELGLSHARGKPVVLLTGNIDDVPFDLRHLRIVQYDVRDPTWAAKVHKNLVSYIKNAKSDPAKSIPQPFRQDNVGEDRELSGHADTNEASVEALQV